MCAHWATSPVAACRKTFPGYCRRAPLPPSIPSWELPPVFQWLQDAGGVAIEEMYRTFNCGIGMIVCVPADQKELAIDTLNAMGESVWQVGAIEAAQTGDADPVVRYAPELLKA